ncbi:MAG: radical SAM protein [Lachnospirales bacterium]
MHYDSMIYRPPTEAYTQLLQVTSGCSHNTCIYCNMYEGVDFKVSPIEEIKADLKEIAPYSSTIRRIYLLNGDPFALSFEKLKEIALLVKKYIPLCNTITMYASVNSIKDKTVDELKVLRKLGINHLYMGIETGHDDTLKYINKGNTSEEAKVQLKKLNEANMDFITILMYGIAGKGKGIENAKATAELMNEVKTIGIGPMNLNILQGTVLYDLMRKGKFEEASDLEKLEELRALIENLEQKEEMLFSCIHMSNLLSLDGTLPRDKKKFLKEIDRVIDYVKKDKISFDKKKSFGRTI